MVKALTDSDVTDRVRVELLEAISQNVKATTTLHKNDAKILKRCEGGFGGNMNECDRQIRFKSRLGVYVYDPLEIRMVLSNGNAKPLPDDPYDKDPGNHKMEWTMPDLIDFKNAVARALKNYLHNKVVESELDTRASGWLGIGVMGFEAHIVLYDYDEDERGTAAQKEAFEFYVHNYAS